MGNLPASIPITRLLLVDDDEIFRERLARALRERAVVVATADGYQTAVAAAKTGAVSHALVDLNMPGPTGMDLVRDLPALCPGIRVVVLTGYGSIATAMEAVRLGAHHYLTKPSDAEQVLAALTGAGQRAAESVRPAAPLATPSLAQAEWEHIQRVLTDCGGNISEAGRRLGIARRTLQLKLKKYPPGR